MKTEMEDREPCTTSPQSQRAYRFLRKVFLMAFVVSALSFSLHAQVACVPPPTNRTPGLPGPPDWIGTFNPPVKTGLDDPRWDGAGSFTWANGTSGDTARFQAISSGTALYLSWFIELPPQGSGPQNTVYVGFTQTGAATPQNLAVVINLKNTTPVNDDTNYNASAYSVDNAGNRTVITGPLPSWINNTRVWTTNSNFAVQMIVPITTAGLDSGVNLGTDFKMWFEMQESLPPATPNTVWDAIFPDGRGGTTTADDVLTSGFSTKFPAPGQWAQFHQSTGPGDAACTLGGISITESQIGTHNIDPISHLPAPHEIQFTQSGVNNLVNTFFASPTNGMTTNIPPGGITATFRIADWGSTYDPNAPWTTIPGGQDVPSTAAINAGTTADINNITFNWTVQDVAGNTWLSDFRNHLKTSDQCMLVELAGGMLKTWQSTTVYAMNTTIVDPAGNLQKVTTAGTSGTIQPTFNSTSGGTTTDGTGGTAVTWTNSGPAIGPGLTFLNNSVLTNMDFVGVSNVNKDAVINIQRLPPLSSADRDVYLYVVTTNMPPVVLQTWKDLFNKFFGPPGNRNPEDTQKIFARMTAAEVNEVVPTYRVFVFHDAGKKITIDNKDYVIVHPQSGFGYYVVPHADVATWQNSIKGATQIGTNLYRIAVHNDGKAKISTNITAFEPSDCTKLPHATLMFLPLSGVLLIGLVIYRPYRKRRDPCGGQTRNVVE